MGARSAAWLASLVLATDLWAMASTDPDFYLPDPFRPMAIAVVLAFVLSGFVRRDWLRRSVRTMTIVLPLVFLVLEVRARYREGREGRVVAAEDRLLRYHYRPGYRGGRGAEEKLEINHLGLWDSEKAIPKPADVFRVVVLTGSIANDGNVPYAKRFQRRLEEDLQGAVPDGRRVETVNVSCEGYNTVEEVRLFEKVGLLYEPDIVVVAHMLTAATLQDGSYRRVGNSFFTFRFLPMLAIARTGSICGAFQPFYDNYSFQLIVRNSFERLELLRRLHGFEVLVAVLPVLEEFDDPLCGRLYDTVAATARDVGFETVRVADAFRGEPVARFTKPGQRWDVCHPNAEGHERIANTIAESIRRMLRAPHRPAPRSLPPARNVTDPPP